MGAWKSKHAIECMEKRDLSRLRRYCRESGERLGPNTVPDTATGDTLLHRAVRSGHVDVVAVLLECMADQSITNTLGRRPLDMAVDNDDVWEMLVGYNSPFLAAALNDGAVARRLAERGKWARLLEVLRLAVKLDILWEMVSTPRGGVTVFHVVSVRCAESCSDATFKELVKVVLTGLSGEHDFLEFCNLAVDDGPTVGDCLSSQASPESRAWFTVIMRSAQPEYSEVVTFASENGTDLFALLRSGFDNNSFGNYERIIGLLRKANCLSELDVFVTAKVTDSDYANLDSTIANLKLAQGDRLHILEELSMEQLLDDDEFNIPSVTFADVVGQDHTVGILTDGCVTPIRRELSNGNPLTTENCRPRNRRFLLYGPPGTGKSLQAAAVAGELRVPLVTVEVDKVRSKWVGETSKLLRSVFNKAKDYALTPRANSGAPGACVVCLSEFDALAAKVTDQSGDYRRSEVASLKQLLELDDQYPMLIIMASVNHVGILAPPIKERLSTLVLCPPPDEEARCQLLRLFARQQRLTFESDDDVAAIAGRTSMCTGRSLRLAMEGAVTLAEDVPRDWVTQGDIVHGAGVAGSPGGRPTYVAMTAQEVMDELRGDGVRNPRSKIVVPVSRRVLDTAFETVNRLTEAELFSYLEDARAHDKKAAQRLARVITPDSSAAGTSDVDPSRTSNAGESSGTAGGSGGDTGTSTEGEQRPPSLEDYIHAVLRAFNNHNEGNGEDAFADLAMAWFEAFRDSKVAESAALDNWTVNLLLSSKVRLTLTDISKATTIGELREFAADAVRARNDDIDDKLVTNGAFVTAEAVLDDDDILVDVLYHEGTINVIFVRDGSGK